VDAIRHMWPPFYLHIHRMLGEKSFHLMSRGYAVLRGNYQLRVVAEKHSDFVDR